MAANRGAVEHVLPVVGEPQIDQRLQKPIPDPLFGPAPEPDIDGVPLAIALAHVAPGTADLQNMKHPVQEPPIIARRTRPAPPLRRQQRPDQRPFRIRQISAIHYCRSAENTSELKSLMTTTQHVH